MKDLAMQDVAERAGAYAQARMRGLAGRAEDFARAAAARVEHLTGRPIESWTAEVRGFVRDNPLGVVAIAIGLGYVLGKLVAPRTR